jgi:hypothetical protein
LSDAAVVPTGAEARRHRSEWSRATGRLGSSAQERVEPRNRAPPSRCPPTATQSLLADPPTPTGKGLRGSTRAAAVSGPSKATSSSAQGRVEPLNKVAPSRCPPTARPSLAGLATAMGKALPGYTGAPPVFSGWKDPSLSAQARVQPPNKVAPSRSPPTATRPSLAGRATRAGKAPRGCTGAAVAVEVVEAAEAEAVGALVPGPR